MFLALAAQPELASPIAWRKASEKRSRLLRLTRVLARCQTCLTWACLALASSAGCLIRLLLHHQTWLELAPRLAQASSETPRLPVELFDLLLAALPAFLLPW